MASVHNAIKYGTSLLRAFSRAIGMDEESSGVERIGETLTPTLDMWRQPEWALLRGERLYHGQRTDAAVAANFSAVGLRNPANSGLLVVVDAVVVFGGNQHRLQLGTGNTLDATAPGFARDTRAASGLALVGTAASRALLFDRTTPAGLFTTAARTIVPDVVTPVDVILQPGVELILSPDAQNTAAIATILWRERKALPGELSGPF